MSSPDPHASTESEAEEIAQTPATPGAEALPTADQDASDQSH